MLFERARQDDSQEIYSHIRQARRDYENAVNRFNTAIHSDMTELAISDINAAMKRYGVIVNSAKKLASVK